MLVVSQAWLCAAYGAVLGCVCGWTVLGQQWAHACCGVVLRSEGGKRADSCLRLRCGAAGNQIGDAGALAVSKALESGNCKLTSLDLSSESAHGCALRTLLSLGVLSVAGRCLGSSGRMLAVVWS